jgi:hypothetical protein
MILGTLVLALTRATLGPAIDHESPETTLRLLLRPIAQDLKKTIEIPDAIADRLVYCRSQPQPAADKLAGILSCLHLRAVTTKSGGLSLEAMNLGLPTNKEALGAVWTSTLQRIDGHLMSTPAEQRKHRLDLERRYIRDCDAGLKDDPKVRQLGLSIEAMMGIEEPYSFLIYRELANWTPAEVAKPFGEPPRLDDCVRRPLTDLDNFGIPKISGLDKQPDAQLWLRPLRIGDSGLVWTATLVFPFAHSTLGTLSLDLPNTPPSLIKRGDLKKESLDRPISLEQARKFEERPSLASVANAVAGAGYSFAAWCPNERLSFGSFGKTTLAKLEQDVPRGRQCWFSATKTWIAFNENPSPSMPGMANWSGLLPVLDQYDLGKLSLQALGRYLAPLVGKQLTALASIRYEHPSLSSTYMSLIESTPLLRAYINSSQAASAAKDGNVNAKLSGLPAVARKDIESYLASAHYVEFYPEWFHERTTFNPSELRFIADRKEGDGVVAVHIVLKNETKGKEVVYADYRLTFARD